MAARPNSSGNGSISGSSGVELPTVNGLNKNLTHPEEWTLPHEWNIEKRELYANWKMDVQNQISNIADTLERSLRTFPHPDVGGRFGYQDNIEKLKLEQEKQQRARMAGNTLIYGLARVRHPINN